MSLSPILTQAVSTLTALFALWVLGGLFLPALLLWVLSLILCINRCLGGFGKMVTTANAIMTLLFSSPYVCFWAVIVAPGAYALIHRIMSVQTRV